MAEALTIHRKADSDADIEALETKELVAGLEKSKITLQTDNVSECFCYWRGFAGRWPE